MIQINPNKPEALNALYPFQLKTREVLINGSTYKQSFVDDGPRDGEVVIMVHGNPTWSFFYRNIINSLKGEYRVIAPDHIGCGLSDKPQDYGYHLEDHVENLENLIRDLGITRFHLILHDWGGAIGSGIAVKEPSRVLSITYMNTAAFTSKTIPWTIDLLRKNFWGEWFIRKFNGFAIPATVMAVRRPMSSAVKKGFLYPYNDYASRIATAKFVKDIPLTDTHPTYKTLKEIEDKLTTLKNVPINLVWGEKDFCFTMEFYHRFLDYFPNAKNTVLKNAGHYLVEDEPEKTVSAIKAFLSELKNNDARKNDE